MCQWKYEKEERNHLFSKMAKHVIATREIRRLRIIKLCRYIVGKVEVDGNAFSSNRKIERRGAEGVIIYLI